MVLFLLSLCILAISLYFSFIYFFSHFVLNLFFLSIQGYHLAFFETVCRILPCCWHIRSTIGQIRPSTLVKFEFWLQIWSQIRNPNLTFQVEFRIFPISFEIRLSLTDCQRKIVTSEPTFLTLTLQLHHLLSLSHRFLLLTNLSYPVGLKGFFSLKFV
jgi:hypothetical protein